MRLLNTTSLELREFFESNIPKYAILSHRWEPGEVTFQDVIKRRNLDAAGWHKITSFCGLVREYGYEWAWLDTCCIDKRSSAELSEAINAMFSWYKNGECFAYLSDVQCQRDDVQAFSALQENQALVVDRESWRDQQYCAADTTAALRTSKWFTRGWTLQELIAPDRLYFVDKDWRVFGSKCTMDDLLFQITGIKDVALVVLSRESIATRMSWASRRSCTRSEDVAYSLMGLFDINMPLLYGEGGRKAFLRLQLEILKLSNDESIFAWSPESGDTGIDIRYTLLTHSARNFSECSNIQRFAPTIPREPYAMTNKGLEITTTLLPARGNTRHFFMPLNCYRQGEVLPLAILLHRNHDGRFSRYGFRERGSPLDWPKKLEVEERDHYEFRKIYLVVDNILHTSGHAPDVVQSLQNALNEYVMRQADGC